MSKLVYSDIDSGNLVFAKINWDIREGFESIYFVDGDGTEWSVNNAKELLEYHTLWPRSQEINVHGPFGPSGSSGSGRGITDGPSVGDLIEFRIRGTRKGEITYYDVLVQLNNFLGTERRKLNIDEPCFFRGLYYVFDEDSRGRPIFKALFSS